MKSSPNAGSQSGPREAIGNFQQTAVIHSGRDPDKVESHGFFCVNRHFNLSAFDYRRFSSAVLTPFYHKLILGRKSNVLEQEGNKR